MAITHFFVILFLLHFGYQLEKYNIENVHHAIFLHYAQTWVRGGILFRKKKICHFELCIYNRKDLDVWPVSFFWQYVV